MTTARTSTLTPVGRVVRIHADMTQGSARFAITGFPAGAMREARDRIRAAIVNSGGQWPQQAITITVSPAITASPAGSSDLAIAIAILAASGALPSDATGRAVFLAGLGLDGRLRPVPGILPTLRAAAESAPVGLVVVPGQNAADAAIVPGIEVITASSLTALTMWLHSAAGLPHDDGRPGPAADRPAP